MEYVSLEKAQKKVPNSQCIVYEYVMGKSDINIGVAEIKGRYPESGFAVNQECTEMGYVMKGSGKLVTDEQSVILKEGDVVYIPAGERYYWEGNFTVVLPCTPAWHLAQHANEY